MAFLAGKRALIIGLATERSIAYGIAEAMKREGAELAFSYQERFKDRVEGMAKDFNAATVFEMDVGSDESITKGFEALKKSWDQFDIIVHAVAFAPTDAIRGGFVESTTRESLFRNPLHPYTQALMSAIPVPNPRLRKQRIILKGDVPSPLNPPRGCRFHPRCPWAIEICSQEEPQFKELLPDHWAACWVAEQKLK